MSTPRVAGNAIHVIEFYKHRNPFSFVSYTPLHLCAKDGHLELCHLLISSKADITSDYAFKGTPLHSAADGWNADVCALLLDANADVNTVGSLG